MISPSQFHSLRYDPQNGATTTGKYNRATRRRENSKATRHCFENTTEQQDVEKTVKQQGTASNTAEQARLQFIQEVLNKRVEFEENGVKKKGEIIWHVLATFVQEELRHLKEQDQVVDATYSNRVKENGSLQEKIKRMQKSKKCQTLDSIREMRWDIAGTRVCLYFPCQLPHVKNFIEQNEHFEIIPYALEDRDKDTELGPTELLRAKPFREREYIMRDPETRPYKQRMGYYEADHYWIRLKKTHPKVLEKIPNYDNEAIEIQVRTVLMDAWAEIRHDLDYKHMLGYPSGDELRVLDIIKGSIASCEMMQDHIFKLRQQRVTRDAESFDFRNPEYFWPAIILSLQPKHSLLLGEFGDVGDNEPDSRYFCDTITKLFSYCNIDSPRELKNKMADLITTQKQKRAILHVRESFSMMSTHSRSKGRDFRVKSERDTLTLFRFIAIFLFKEMGTEDIQKKLYGEIYKWNDRYQLPLENLKNRVVRCASRWYQMLSTVLQVLWNFLDFVNDEEYDLYMETISTSWHVHEWVATTYQNEMKLDQIISVVTRLCSHFRKLNDNVWNERALWLCAVVTFVQFEERSSPWNNVEDPHGDVDSWNRGRASHGTFLIQEDWESVTWRKGEQLAAEIIGVDATQLKHATLYRALCQSPDEDDYVLYCLEDKDIDVNWQDSCGISLLGAAAAFGTLETYEAMLALPGVNCNMAFSDGLSLIHIAVGHENKAMIKLLTSNRDLDIEAIWRVYERKFLCEFWTSRDYTETWDWDNDGDQATDEKLSWTALEMAERRLGPLGLDNTERPKLRHIYDPLVTACRSKSLYDA